MHEYCTNTCYLDNIVSTNKFDFLVRANKIVNRHVKYINYIYIKIYNKGGNLHIHRIDSFT